MLNGIYAKALKGYALLLKITHGVQVGEWEVKSGLRCISETMRHKKFILVGDIGWVGQVCSVMV